MTTIGHLEAVAVSGLTGVYADDTASGASMRKMMFLFPKSRAEVDRIVLYWQECRRVQGRPPLVVRATHDGLTDA